MAVFRLTNFNINKVNSIIGCYDDIKNKEQQIVNGKKTFRKFLLEMNISPKNPRSYIVSSRDYEIGDFNKKVNVVPFLKDDELYFQIIDNNYINVKCYVDLIYYYDYREGSNIVKNMIKDNNIKFCIDDNREKFEEVFINNKHFNYTKDIEWIDISE